MSEEETSNRVAEKQPPSEAELPAGKNLAGQDAPKWQVTLPQGPATSGRGGRWRWRRFIYNLFVGLALYLLALHLGKTGTGEEIADKGFDIFTILESQWFANRSVPVSDSPIYFIEITHNDHKRWDQEDVTNRTRLARLVEAAYERGADVVVLDVLFQKPADGDLALLQVFGNFTSQRLSKSKSSIVLPAEIDADGNLKRTIFDDLIVRHPDIFWRGLAYIEATGSKALIRYWTRYQSANTPGGKEEGIWGIPALVAAIASKKDGNLSQEKKDYVYSQRIRYRLMPETRSTLRVTIAADQFDADGRNPLPPLKGKIVLIGNTSPDMTDTHRTPVGDLPGLFILGNAINTVLLGLRAPILPRAVSFLFQFSAILVAAVACTLYPSSRAYFITVSVYLITLIPLGCLMYLTQGDLYNYMLPVVGMKLRMELSKFHSIYQRLRGFAEKLRGFILYLIRWRREEK